MARRWNTASLLFALTALLSACANLQPEETRPHDARQFKADASATTFAALAPQAGEAVDVRKTSRWAGVLGGAAYQIEVPARWNGMLVMYAHGYRGTGEQLTVNPPPIRRHLIQMGYAWAASSYSKNYYDVRAGIEDTNALALAFTRIAAQNARPLAAPSRTYITGHSMGGHISAAAVEAETLATANNKLRYHAALPMCGVMADTELFDIFASLQKAAYKAAGIPSYLSDKWAEVQELVQNTLFSSFPTAQTPATPIVATAKGQAFLTALKDATGGERPLFEQALAFGGSFRFAFGALGGDGTVNGILAKNLNTAPDANRLRRDGLRWIPRVNGEISVPVLSIHTLGDLYVPFSMQKTYLQRTSAKGNGSNVVLRAMRGAAHCDFTVAEQAAAFDALMAWEQKGLKPAGDDLLNPATVASPRYGCAFTNDSLGPEDSANTRNLRARIAQSAACTR